MNVELQEIADAKRGMSESEQAQFEAQYTRMRKDPTTALILSLVFGSLGVDRFYVGDTGLGIAKLLTLGGLLIWTFVDLYLIGGAAHSKNVEAIREVKASVEASRPAGGLAV